ncbi:MAG: tRNA (adenosine(37)-N6)-threonylcarbamoyltransferase complex ATPase subunit type 1 TsaE [Candidatus Omnitrophica bacterium]|nr:tRNA (adenosine(37)-N6)-threonylcarbamoyltransferase complex ATPase subunit type 1 TsaE [Candidatus Omnitrophota bacterium]MCF7876756.1 tRNA (adenosine(37)-N6)-threonylcarbamoyltransferase complex ATPase subunit type 1 TsaE [Candidatus Omnitrophota bacterium]MCF7878204.1 tRNA (adenosine(37)-N6)-threonylcarbamoyltransferase complex ATPase subunit type 1 TsaE [Candidatus Omnitrophota bacterium]MCF7892672.1 tRNA (adenosine(37)-N6)-threonylcarbamoyltransferase complex ATPase subunit type 1 TsaE [
MVIISESVSQTKKIGGKFSKFLERQDIVLLKGQLGAGKTTFVKGVLEGLGYKKLVLSPSFTLVRSYKTGTILVNHIDLYRLSKKNLNSIDIEEYLYNKDSISIIEWGKKIEPYLEKYFIVDFSFVNMEKRKLSISQKGYKRNLKIEL